MYRLPKKLDGLVPYEPLAGSFLVRLDANESFLAPSAKLHQAIRDAIAAVQFNRYPDPFCVGLCEKCAAFFGADPRQIVAGNGSDELIGLLISSFVERGEGMAVVAPDFSMYRFYAQLNGVKVHTFTKDSGTLALDSDALIALVKEKNARLLILSNPCNPTSLTASRAEVLKLVRALDCLVVIDEAYMDFADGSVLDEVGKYDNLVVLKTCSKAFGMAAIRLGFAFAPPPIANALRAVKSPYNVNSMTQAAGCALFEHGDELHACTERIKASRDALYRHLMALSERLGGKIEVLNTRANFIYLRLDDAAQVFDGLCERGIAVRLMEPYLRISAGSEIENEAVSTALEQLIR